MQIRDYPEVGWYLGDFTQTFHLLTEAYAVIMKMPVAQVRETFLPRKPFDPRAKGFEEGKEAAREENAPRLGDDEAENIAFKIVGEIMLSDERPKITRLVGVDADGVTRLEWLMPDLKACISKTLLEIGGAT